MESKRKIRRLHFVEGWSIGDLMKHYQVSRNTIRKVLRDADIGKGYERLVQPMPRLGAHKELLERWLMADAKLPKSQRRSAKKMYEMLKPQGYDGSYGPVQRFVSSWKDQTNRLSKKAYIPQIYGLAEAYQFDWSEEVVELARVVVKIRLAQFRLCYSRKFIVIAYLRETQEMLFDAHVQAFEFFGGVLLRGIYDNLKTAVDAVFVGKERKFNRRFLELMNHYLIEPTACSPAAGWEKGQVENQVGNVREWLFVPRLKFDSIEALNAHLRQRCIELSNTRKHPEQKDLTVQQVFEQQEQSALRALASPFDGYQERSVTVSSTCLVNFDCNRYSVDWRLAHKVVSVRAYAAYLEVVSEGEVIAHHPRSFLRDQVIYNPWHYVSLLERKPGALRNGAPFKDWDLPKALTQTREHLVKSKGGDRKFVNILMAISHHGLEAVTIACELAISEGVIAEEYILNLLNRLRPTMTAETLTIEEGLKLKEEPQSNCHRYNQLLKGASYAIH